MNTSLEIDKICEALALAQGCYKTLIKNRKANYGMYADLAAVIESTSEALHANSLCISQSPAFKEGRLSVTTRLFHKSGQWIENEVSLKPGQDTAQGIGGVITYGRRYGLTSLLGICADDDDDGASAQPQHEPKKAYGVKEAPKQLASPVVAPVLKDIHLEVFNHESESHRLLVNEIMTSAGMTKEQKHEMAPKFRGRLIKDIISYIDAQKKEEPMITFNN